MLNWGFEKMEVYEKDIQENEKGLSNGEEVKVMFGQIKKDCRDLVNRMRDDEETAQPSLISLLSLLCPALFTSFLLASMTVCSQLKL